MGFVKKSYILVVFLLVFTLSILKTPIYAIAGQWSASGGIIYYNDGNVGIGTNNPVAKLDLAGNDVNSDTKVLNLSTVNQRGWEVWAGRYAHPSKGDYSLTISQPVYSGCEGCVGDLLFKPGRNLNITQGNVGIGTSAPTQRLDVIGTVKSTGLQVIGGAFVDGTLKAKEIQVKANIWADYVFDEAYKLMSLKDLDQYIKENKHLPNIPSAEEIEKNGISVGEMQQKQMEKIEELILHLIEMNKRVEELEGENRELEERLEKLERLVEGE